MPVTKSAKRAQRVSTRRHEENLLTKDLYKKAIKVARKAISVGADEVDNLLSVAQSAIDRAAKKNAMHKNKASRLKSRLAHRASTTKPAEATEKKAKASTAKKAATKKTTAKKTTTKKK